MSEDRLQTREADPLISQWLDLVSSPYVDPSQMRLIGTEMGNEIMQLRAEIERLRSASLTEDDIFTLQVAVENLRSPERTESIIEAAFRIASRLEALAKRATAHRR